MIILELTLLYLSVVATSVVSFILPFVIGFITSLLHIGIPIYIILFVIVGGAITMGFFWYYFDKKLIGFIQRKPLPIKHSTLWDKTIGKIEHVLQKSHNIYVVRCATTIASWSSIPDILIIRLVRNKLSIYQRLSAYILGKIVLYIPIIYAAQFALRLMEKM